MPRSSVTWRQAASAVRPMLASLSAPPLQSKTLVYEPKYDGIRAIVDIEPHAKGPVVRLWSRLGNEKTKQFPSIVHALEKFGATLKGPLVLDGEVVALDALGRPAGFQRLQSRIHLSDARDVERLDHAQPVALIAFDLLRDGSEDLRGLPLTDRRLRLEALLEGQTTDVLRLSEQVKGDARDLYVRAKQEGWEGLIAKDASSPYHTGRRTPAWMKLKVVHEQEFVIGGWTEPRQTRQYFGALLLGVYERPAATRSSKAPANPLLTYVGHTGTGFDQAELQKVSKLLKARETKSSPFSAPIKTNEPAHWVKPELVAQVRFTEWTDDNKLRHPVYLGLRDDKKASDVVREEVRQTGARNTALGARARLKPEATDSAQAAVRLKRNATPPGTTRRSDQHKTQDREPFAATQHVVEQLNALQDARKDGAIELPDGSRLSVTNLAKVFWPEAKLTKGDLLRYYATVSPFMLPVVADRPLVMKRFPNGIHQPAFYQQRSRLEKPPAGVRIEQLAPGLDPISEADARRFIGGSLITLLYMTQMAAISQDPWFSRVQSPLEADYVALDLDPGDDTPFARVLDVARWVRDELASLKVPAVPKTSGSSGLHVYIPLPPGTSYESGMLFCQIVATVVASRHPKVATVERMVRRRARGTVYVDFLQNILGKTLATAYSARASEFAGVSTPLAWNELDEAIDPRDFTIRSAPARFRETGDLWKRLRESKPANLEAVFRKYAK
jgi:bifunctional non-homologous end joining protein LigD